MTNETKHTPEPWEIRKHSYGNVRDAEGIFMVGNNAAIVDGVYGRNIHESEANARRIVACVNACAGITTESLEAEGKDALDIAAAIKQLGEQRDELAEAAKAVTWFDWSDENDQDAVDAVEALRAALAKIPS